MPEDHTICRFIAPLGRLLHMLNQNRFVREVTWYQYWTPARKGRVVCRLSGVGRLHCFLAVDTAPEHADEDKLTIRKVLCSLEENYQTHLERGTKTPQPTVATTAATYHTNRRQQGAQHYQHSTALFL